MTDCSDCPVSLGCHAGTLNTRMGGGTVLCPICLDFVVVVPADPVVPGHFYRGRPMRRSQVNNFRYMNGTQGLASGPSIREDGSEDLTMRLRCCERPVELDLRKRWFSAFYNQGTAACLKIKDPGPPQRHAYIYMKMCMPCWKLYYSRIHHTFNYVAPRECKLNCDRVNLVHRMLECCVGNIE